jgi:hypothetical protein
MQTVSHVPGFPSPWPTGWAAIKRRWQCFVHGHESWAVGERRRYEHRYSRVGSGTGEIYTCTRCGCERVGALSQDKVPRLTRVACLYG